MVKILKKSTKSHISVTIKHACRGLIEWAASAEYTDTVSLISNCFFPGKYNFSISMLEKWKNTGFQTCLTINCHRQKLSAVTPLFLT